MTYIKENIITKLQKQYSPPRKPRAGSKSPALFLKKPLCMGDLLPTCKIFIERPELYIDFKNYLVLCCCYFSCILKIQFLYICQMSIVQKLHNKPYLNVYFNVVTFHKMFYSCITTSNCMLWSCHVRVSEWIHTVLFAWISRNSLLEKVTITEV